MRLRTHYVFSTGLLALVNSFLLHDFYLNLILSGMISVVSNSLIDQLGHEIKGGYISRTPRTHTIPRSVLWGLIPSIVIIFLIEYIEHSSLRTYSIITTYFILLLVDGILVGPSHMLLDIFTERGIFVKKNGRWRRFALAHFRYNNPAVNGLAIFIGAVMLYLAFII